MNQNIKNVIVFYAIVLVSLLTSSVGIYILNDLLGRIYVGATLFIIPLLLIYTIIYKLIPTKKASE